MRYDYLPIEDTRLSDRDELYLDLLKRCLTRAVVATEVSRHTLMPGRPLLRSAAMLLRAMLDPLRLEMVRQVRSRREHYDESTHTAARRHEDAESMLGLKQFDQMQACVRDVIDRGVPGDLLEAGVWRGGMTIYMRALLRLWDGGSRKVWAVDSFEGLPDPDQRQDSFGWNGGDMSESLDTVKANFRRYRMLDDGVVFVKGFFSETLPNAGIDRLAVLRVDADLYESTMDVLVNLYDKLSPGGYAIFDDYQNLVDCRRAVDEFRQRNGIGDPIVAIDERAVYWIKSG